MSNVMRVYRMWHENATLAELERRKKARDRKGGKSFDDDESYALAVNDGLALMSLPHDRIGPVLDQWPRNLSFRVEGDGEACDVLSHPCAFICTSRFKDGISSVCGEIVEWLPVNVETIGEMYVFHPIRGVKLGPGAKYKRGSSKENITWIDKYDFEEPDKLPLCFLIAQPPETPSGKIGGSVGGVCVTEQLRSKMWGYRGIDFACVFVGK